MAITRDEVLHVARLARLALTEEEISKFQEQLSAILEAVGKVGQARPLRRRAGRAPSRPRERLRARRARPSLPVEEALANAPEREDGYFRVPRGARGMIDTLRLTAKEANDLLTSGEASSDEIFAAYRAAIDERDGELNASSTSATTRRVRGSRSRSRT